MIDMANTYKLSNLYVYLASNANLFLYYSLFIVPIDTTVSCPLAPDILNGYRLNEAFYAHSTVTYQCYDGFWFEDHTLQSTVTCLLSGRWNNIPSSCTG